MKNILKSHITAVAIGAALMAGGLALADKTIVLKSADAKVTRICFDSNDNGVKISAEACGFTKDSTGAIQPSNCVPPKDLPSGAFKTAIAPLFTGAALTYWKTENGL
jgi:hypothetical protein